MSRVIAILIGTLIAVLASTGPAPAQMVFTATLDGAQETPPNASPATGTATGTLNAAMTQFTFTLNYSGLTGTSINSAHIHNAPAGTAGGVVRTIFPDFGPGTVPDGTFMGTWSNTDPEPLTPFLVGELQAGRLYFNIHTDPNFTGGEIRGQIQAAPEPGTLLLAAVGMIGVGAAQWKRHRSKKGHSPVSA